jgi:hypothetical protein
MHGSRVDGLVEPVRSEILRLGGVIDRLRLGRHVIIYWSIAGRKLITVVPRTSSNLHALGNLLSHVRKSARSAP